MLTTAVASFTRPNDTNAYTAGDLVANNTTAGSVVPMSFYINNAVRGCKVVAIKLQKSNSTATNGNFHLRLYGSSPTCANGDNGAWSTNLSGYLAKIDPAIVEAFTDGCAVVDSLSESADIHIVPSSGVLYGLLVADAAYTPAAQEVFTVTLILDLQ